MLWGIVYHYRRIIYIGGVGSSSNERIFVCDYVVQNLLNEILTVVTIRF